MNTPSFQLIDENEDFLVIYKPEGLSVHNQYPSLSEQLTLAKKALHFINRLDLETSGLMVIANRPELHAPLAEDLEKGQKFYRALLRSPWKQNQQELLWSWPLSDKAEGRKNPQGVASDRVKAETKVQIVRSNQYFTEVYLELITGRQHQIRKHSALANHPIVGDPRYNEEKYNTNIQKFYGNKRMLLHAEKLEFIFKNKNYVYENKMNLDSFFGLT
jgi:23S rRNA-/tRNA-specific pseudouridylate synthase